MAYKTEAFDVLIKKKFGTHKAFAAASGIEESSLSKAFKRGKFTTDQISTIARFLELSSDDVMVYFFTPTDAKRQPKGSEA